MKYLCSFYVLRPTRVRFKQPLPHLPLLQFPGTETATAYVPTGRRSTDYRADTGIIVQAATMMQDSKDLKTRNGLLLGCPLSRGSLPGQQTPFPELTSSKYTSTAEEQFSSGSRFFAEFPRNERAEEKLAEKGAQGD